MYLSLVYTTLSESNLNVPVAGIYGTYAVLLNLQLLIMNVSRFSSKPTLTPSWKVTVFGQSDSSSVNKLSNPKILECCAVSPPGITVINLPNLPG